MLTVAIVGAFLLAFAAGLLLNFLFLRLGARWAKIEGASWKRLLAAALAIGALGLLFGGLSRLLAEKTRDIASLASVLEVALQPIAAWVAIALILRVKFWRAAQAWLPTLIPGAAMVALVLLVVRPFLLEAFKTPSNSMAPTLLGLHQQGVCPTCGGPAYCSATPGLMICEQGFHTAPAKPSSNYVHEGDRFLVCKFLAPRRWDVVVFLFPEEPTNLYTKRLVGLPGEEVSIKDGAVWINGEKQTPPESLKGITYVTDMGHGISASWGTAAHPAKLGPDEYFVLGDFSLAARDSRFWEKGAPGHAPYAVPASYLRGVVTHIYWPLSRCRVLR
ncbi:MAG: signal peptidase I [Thermoguttaceae bacterium]|jgi:signal peptidase I